MNTGVKCQSVENVFLVYLVYQVHLVCLVYLVCQVDLVYLVCLVDIVRTFVPYGTLIETDENGCRRMRQDISNFHLIASQTTILAKGGTVK